VHIKAEGAAQGCGRRIDWTYDERKYQSARKETLQAKPGPEQESPLLWVEIGEEPDRGKNRSTMPTERRSWTGKMKNLSERAGHGRPADLICTTTARSEGFVGWARKPLRALLERRGAVPDRLQVNLTTRRADMEKDLKLITKHELDELSRNEGQDLKDRAADALDAMEKAERDELENDACLNYQSTVDNSITEAGEELSATMAELRRRFGTLIVDAVLNDKPNLEDLSLFYEGPAESIAEVEENHPTTELAK
jgi:hypothetical protein